MIQIMKKNQLLKTNLHPMKIRNYKPYTRTCQKQKLI